jgi:hypothetical protein
MLATPGSPNTSLQQEGANNKWNSNNIRETASAGTPAIGELLSRNARNHGGNTKNKKNMSTTEGMTSMAGTPIGTRAPKIQQRLQKHQQQQGRQQQRLREQSGKSTTEMLTKADTSKNSDANNSTSVSNNRNANKRRKVTSSRDVSNSKSTKNSIITAEVHKTRIKN